MMYFFNKDILHTKKSGIVNEVIRTIYFFYRDILHKKKPTKHSSNVYSDTSIRLKT